MQFLPAIRLALSPHTLVALATGGSGKQIGSVLVSQTLHEYDEGRRERRRISKPQSQSDSKYGNHASCL